MDEKTGTVRYAYRLGVHHLLLQGDVMSQLTGAWTKAMEDMELRAGDDVLVDLVDATAVDSTMLGALAKLAKVAKAVGIRPRIACDSTNLVDLLRGISFDTAFDLVDRDGRRLDGADDSRDAAIAGALARREALVEGPVRC